VCLLAAASLLGLEARAQAGSWSRTQLGWGVADPSSPDATIAVDPTSPSRLIVTPYRSQDAGASWQRIGALPTAGDLLTTAYAADARLFAFYVEPSGDTSLAVSPDNGASWTLRRSGLFHGDAVTGVALDPHNPSGIVVITATGGVDYSTDAGASFHETTSPPFIQQLAVAPDGTIFGVAGDVFSSADDGAHWMRVGPADHSQDIAALAVAGTGHQHLFAISDDAHGTGSLVASSDGGAHFTTPAAAGLCSGVFLGAISIAVAPSDPATLYATCSDGSVDISRDAGASFASLAAVTPQPQALTAFLAIDPLDAAHVWFNLGVPNGVYDSHDGGVTLTQHTGGMAGAPITLLQQTPDGTLLASTGQFVWRSTDHGASFAALSEQMDASDQDVQNPWAVDPTAPSTLYETGDGVIGRSTDGGLTWSFRGIVPTCSNVPAIGVDAAGTVYAIDQTNDLFVSTDGAQTFTSLQGPGGVGVCDVPPVPVAALYVDPTQTGVVYALYGSSQVSRSSDGGHTWTSLDAPSGVLANAIVARGSLICLSGPGAHTAPSQTCSTDAGATWYPAPLAPLANAWFAQPPTTSAPLLGLAAAATLWESEDGGAAWAPVGNDPGAPTQISPPTRVSDQSDGTLPAAGPVLADQDGRVFAGLPDGLAEWSPAPAGSVDTAVSMSVPATSPTGSLFPVTVTVSNTGSLDADASFDLALPANITISATRGGLCNAGHCEVGPLAPGASATVSFNLVGANAEADTISVHLTTPGDENPANDQASSSITISAPDSGVDAALALDAPPAATSGVTFAVTATVSNVGPEAASPTLTLNLPAGVSLTRADPSQGSCAGAQCPLGQIARGASATVELVLVAASPGQVTLTAQLTTPGDAHPSNDGAVATITITPPLPPPPAHPGAKLSQGALTLVHGVAAVRITCPAARGASCHGTLTLASASRVRSSRTARPRIISFGSARVSLARGKTISVHVRAPVASVKLLRRLHHIKLRITCTLSAPHTATSRIVSLR
jgi:photosystem II stability/assembly factor-like uncharacterized protein